MNCCHGVPYKDKRGYRCHDKAHRLNTDTYSHNGHG